MTTTQNPTAHVVTVRLPFIVCPSCDGHGTTGPGHVFTQADLDEQFGPDQYEVMADYRAGRYDVACAMCAGQRVVREDCLCADCEQEREDDAFDREVARAERAFGC